MSLKINVTLSAIRGARNSTAKFGRKATNANTITESIAITTKFTNNDRLIHNEAIRWEKKNKNIDRNGERCELGFVVKNKIPDNAIIKT